MCRVVENAFVITDRKCLAVRVQRGWILGNAVHVILRGLGEVGDMVLPCAVAEEGDVLSVDVEQSEQQK